jgi:3-methyladenine DNA glycosylase Mpg
MMNKGTHTLIRAERIKVKDASHTERINRAERIILTYIHTYHLRFIPEGVAEVSQIFFRDIHVLPK